MIAAVTAAQYRRGRRCRRQLDLADCSGVAECTPATRSSQSDLENAPAAASNSSSDSSGHCCAVSPRQQRCRRQLDLADRSGAAVRIGTPATLSSLSYLEETSAASGSSSDSSTHSCAVSPLQQPCRRQLDFADCSGAAVRTNATRSSLSYLEQAPTAARSSSDSSSHSCAASPRQQRRRRQLDFADCSDSSARMPGTRSSLSYLEETPAAARSSSDSSSHSCAVSRYRRQLDFE